MTRTEQLRKKADRWKRHNTERWHRVRSNPGWAVQRVRRRVELAGARLVKTPLLSAAERSERDRLVAAGALDPRTALAENGFVIFRGLVPRAECAQLSARLKREAGITDGVEFTRTDATNKIPGSRDWLFDERLLGAVRACVGDEVRFLQTSDLHYLHDTTGWHRDSVHRELDNSASADWAEPGFGVVKAIVYLETENAAMGMIGGSHLSPLAIDHDLVRTAEKRGEQIVVDIDDEPNRRYGAGEKRLPMAWRAQPGDVLVFDQRMYHAGRRVDAGKVSTRADAPKFTLSLVFGVDNAHSERFFSYFRYARRELGYRPFGTTFSAQLAERGLLMSSGESNYYEQHPDELRLATLRRRESMQDLVEQFSRSTDQS